MSKFWVGRNPNGEVSDAWIQGIAAIDSGAWANIGGASPLNSSPDAFAQLDSNGDMQLPADIVSISNGGTAEAGVTSVEYGGKYFHKTVITLTAKNLGALTAGAHAIGAKVYTFPAGGDIVIYNAVLQCGITGDAPVQADTPDVGVGTTIASGASATLNLVAATAENVITGQTWSTGKMAGTEQSAIVTNQPLILAAGTNALFINAADTWAGISATDVVTGTLTVNWLFLV